MILGSEDLERLLDLELKMSSRLLGLSSVKPSFESSLQKRLVVLGSLLKN